MTSYSAFKQKLVKLKEILESEETFSLGKAVEINRNKMSIPIIVDSDSFQIQLPECGTKQGIMSTGSRTYVDLMFDSSVDNAYLLELEDFITLLQSKCAHHIYNKRGDWLATDIDEDNGTHSIETFEEMFYPVIRAVNRGANTVLRVDIGRGSRGSKASLPPETSCELYNKNGQERPLAAIHKNSRLIPLITFSEILISSTSINLVVELKECLLLNEPDPIPRRDRSIMFEEMSSGKDSVTDDRQMEKETTENQDIVSESKDFSEAEETEEADDKIGNEELVEVDISIDDEEQLKQPEENEEGLTEINDLEITADVPLTLKEPDEVYREIYRAAIAKAKRLRQVALDAYLDAKKIKARFMLDDIDYSEDEEDMEDIDDVTQQSFS